MLQRIYGGIHYPKRIKEVLLNWKKPKKETIEKLKEQKLFSLQDDIGGGLVLWHPKEPHRNVIENYRSEQHQKNGRNSFPRR